MRLISQLLSLKVCVLQNHIPGNTSTVAEFSVNYVYYYLTIPHCFLQFTQGFLLLVFHSGTILHALHPTGLGSSLFKWGQPSPQLRASPTLRCQSWPLTLQCYPADNASTSFGTFPPSELGWQLMHRVMMKNERSYSHPAIQILTFIIKCAHTHTIACMVYTCMHKNKLGWTLASICIFQTESMPTWAPSLRAAPSSSLEMGSNTRVLTKTKSNQLGCRPCPRRSQTPTSSTPRWAGLHCWAQVQTPWGLRSEVHAANRRSIELWIIFQTIHISGFRGI